VKRIKTIAEVDEDLEERSSIWGGTSDKQSKNDEGYDNIPVNYMTKYEQNDKGNYIF